MEYTENMSIGVHASFHWFEYYFLSENLFFQELEIRDFWNMLAVLIRLKARM